MMTEALTILAVDDSETDQHLYSRALKGSGHALVQALTGGDGLEKFTEVKPDLILLDYNLPDFNGLIFLKRLAELIAVPPPVVMLTGAGDETIAVEAMKSGAVEYLVKDTAGAYLRQLPRVIGRARASAEERNRARRLNALNSAILKTVADGILGIGCDGIILFANPAAERMLGASTGGLAKRRLREFVHQNGHEGSWENHPLFTACGAGTELRRECDFFQRPGGGSFPVAYNATPLDFEEGGRSGWVVAFQDITERKAAEEELLRHQDQLEMMVEKRTADLRLACEAAEAANKAKTAFLANMSHQLRTPLNAILGFSAMLLSDPHTTPEQCERLSIVHQGGEDLLMLINGILEITKIEAGRIDLEIAPFNLGAMVRDVADMMRLRAADVGLRLDVEQSSLVPCYIRSDGGRLRQILINLADNAVKFTKTGGITIRLDWKPGVPPYLVMEVEDTGPGLSPEEQKRLFQRFGQLGEAGTQKGAGLGLAVTRQFAELMGGTISVKSEAGKGALFRVEVPVEVVEAAPPEERRGDAFAVAGRMPGTPGRRILIADDQAENRTQLKQLMEKIGLDVMEAPNGAECVRIFQEWRPHLVWMDRRMPVMTGTEAAQCIRRLPEGQDVKIIAATAAVFKEQQQEMLDAGMDDLVHKPYRTGEIYACLAKHLGVEYVYDAGPAKAIPAPAALTPEMLAILPPPLREELMIALESLDAAGVDAAVSEASRIDEALGRALKRLAENFDYPVILKALSASTAAAEHPHFSRVSFTLAK